MSTAEGRVIGVSPLEAVLPQEVPVSATGGKFTRCHLEVVLPEEVPVSTTGSKVSRCLSPGGGLT